MLPCHLSEQDEDFVVDEAEADDEDDDDDEEASSSSGGEDEGDDDDARTATAVTAATATEPATVARSRAGAGGGGDEASVAPSVDADTLARLQGAPLRRQRRPPLPAGSRRCRLRCAALRTAAPCAADPTPAR